MFKSRCPGEELLRVSLWKVVESFWLRVSGREDVADVKSAL
jgi:hypothetical protein